MAHPGHELRVYGWMTQARPVVHVLTDGSGSDGEARIDSSTALLKRVGATRGSIYGRMSDREIYGAILARDHARFIEIAEELAGTLVRSGTAMITGDAVEGFNPSHDVCRYIINAAVRMASAASHDVACYAFPLDGAPDGCPDESHGRAVRVQLDDGLLDRKLQAAHAYAELRSEVESALERFGKEPFRLECLCAVDLADPYGWDPDRIPYYESYGAQRVAKGAYEHVVTFREHVKPLADALWCHRAVTA
ncbi:MAG TPA: hypothetical protein VHG09_02765 [Longimicrobiales bacterium]|nr:hypothetical protein [Longimicrobiales bacterium]